MKKTAVSEYPINEHIANRWSPRAFSDQPIADGDLNSLFEAARWAASSMNEQPWQFIYAKKGEEAYGSILQTLADGNKPWAKNAPVLIAVLARTTFSRNGALNDWAAYDTGMAVANLSIQATELGIRLHQMGGFSKEMIADSFQLPDHVAPIAIIALGYPGDPEQLPEPLRQRELATRTRKSISVFTFHQTYHQ